MIDLYSQVKPTLFVRSEDPGTVRIRPGVNLDKRAVRVLAECSTRDAYLRAVDNLLPQLKYYSALRFSFEPMPRGIYDVLYKDFVTAAEKLPFLF